jgi:hypothetical protein
MKIQHALIALATAAAICAAPSPCRGQRFEVPKRQGPPRIFGGGELIYARPQGDFANYVNQGWGAAGHFLWAADPRGILALRIDGGILQYGNERKRACISTTIGCRVVVDVNTSNNIFFAGIGPQLMAPTGSLRPYVNGTAGFSYFFTESSVSGSNDVNSSFASTTNFHDGVFSTAAGGGLYIPVTVSKTRFSIDVGARYHWNGKTRYLREGGITDLPDGSIQVEPIESRTDLLTYHIGVSFGAR